MKKKRLITFVALALSISIFATGCGQNKAQNTGQEGSTPAAQTASVEKKPLRLGHYGTACEAALFMAYEKGFFKNEGIDVELVKGDYEANKDGLASGKLDATDGVLQQWLKPTEQGLDLKFTTGIHTGCVSAITGANSTIQGVKDFKGKTVGVSGGIGGGPMNYAFRLLLQAGLNPQTDVTWKNYPGPQLEVALAKGEIDAAVTGDTLALGWVKKGEAKVVASMAKNPPFDKEICCLLGFNGEYLKNNKDAAIKVSTAIIKAAHWVDKNPDEAAKIMVEKKYILGTPELNAALLKDYKFNAGVNEGKEALRSAINEFKASGILAANTDTEQLIKKIYIEIPEVVAASTK